MTLAGKKIVVGITGSIAAYKTVVLIRQLIKKGAEVQVVITPAGKEFVTPITLSALTCKPVVSEFFSQRDGSWNSHVDLGLWADLLLIAPATAATIGKMAHGVADNMLITTYLSAKSPVIIAPAMDRDMYAHPSTQRNLALLQNYGNYIIEPNEGHLASNLEGKGRMQEPESIVAYVENFFHRQEAEEAGVKLLGKKVLITAGPTYEKIDPVRFIGNYSSGKMGFAIAEECAARGANVTIVSGPVSIQTTHPNIRRIDVETAAEMYYATISEYTDCEIAILAAAVADFTPAQIESEKIKRKDDDLVLQLMPTTDIAYELGQTKERQILVGFALETQAGEEQAREKLRRKNLDCIVLNSLMDEGAGFRQDTNKITILTESEVIPYSMKTKHEVAVDIIDFVETTFV